jgi:hypothetical protein
MSRSSGLLRMKASRARVFQSGLQTDGGTTMGACTSYHHRGHVRIKLKMNESMRRVTSDSAILSLSFSMY